jgi:hypothetical protein
LIPSEEADDHDHIYMLHTRPGVGGPGLVKKTKKVGKLKGRWIEHWDEHAAEFNINMEAYKADPSRIVQPIDYFATEEKGSVLYKGGGGGKICYFRL